tara:strand:+ start:606 stop:881 length:276 start_codon:yes stop_codon:yes gene_type:complete
MSLFEAMKFLDNAEQVVRLLAKSAEVLGDRASTEEEKKDARKAKALGDKKMAKEGKAKGGNVSKMAYGGMANGKKHMYVAGGKVTENQSGK